MVKEFQDKLVLITGGAGDIARASAARFAEGGARLILTDIDTDGLESLAGGLRAKGAEVECEPLDVTDAQRVGEVLGRIGRIDVLVNCVGVYRHKLVVDMTESDWDETLDVNLKGVFSVCRAAGRIMKEQSSGGAMVNLASVSAQRGSVSHAHYCASKSGIIGFGRALALELAPRVRVNTVAPGIIESRMIDEMLKIRGEEWKAQIPLGRFGSASDVAEAIFFLAGEKASYINGAVLNVNGGMWMD